jgi:hypothetical protein
VSNISRGKLTVVAPGQEELPLNCRDQTRIAALLADDSNEAESPEKSKKKKEEDAFCSMDPRSLTLSPHIHIIGDKRMSSHWSGRFYQMLSGCMILMIHWNFLRVWNCRRIVLRKMS